MPFTLRAASSLLLGVLLGALSACSGAAPQALEMAQPGSGSASSSDAGGSATKGEDAGSTSGPPSEDSGSAFGAPAPSNCPANGVVESGGNDSQSTAQEFSNVGCGILSPGGTDWWRFRLPGGATKLAINYSGKVSLAVTTQGTTIEVGSGAPIPFHPNAEYDIEVTSSHSLAEPYVILVETN